MEYSDFQTVILMEIDRLQYEVQHRQKRRTT